MVTSEYKLKAIFESNLLFQREGQFVICKNRVIFFKKQYNLQQTKFILILEIFIYTLKHSL